MRAQLVSVIMGSLAACALPDPYLSPRGEALIVVDTDLPVPKLAGQLRLDVYSDDGARWLESREAALVAPSDWPASFSIYEEQGERVALVRLRVYPEGKTRDYRGERFSPRPVGQRPEEPVVEPPATDEPRLESGPTPTSEPQPLLTVDRLFRVRLTPGNRGSVRIVLRGVCVGTMADLDGLATCVDTENVRADVAELPLDSDMSRPTATLAGTFAPSRGCSSPPRVGSRAADFSSLLYDEEVCVPGGVFIFGDARENDVGAANGVPERLAIMPPFRFDRYEVTVGRLRDAFARGLVPLGGELIANPGLLPSAPTPDGLYDPSLCTWSDERQAREEYPVNCISPYLAQSFCRFAGGDLPSEAEWEYVASAAARPYESRFPWGDGDSTTLTCSRAVFGRESTDAPCFGEGYGPQRVNEKSEGDRTLGLGVVGMGGNVAEVTRTYWRGLTTACWAASGLTSPDCINHTREDLFHSSRGGSWLDPATSLRASRRSTPRAGVTGFGQTPFHGFRCMRPERDP